MEKNKNIIIEVSSISILAGIVLSILESAFYLVSLVVIRFVSRSNEFNADSHGAIHDNKLSVCGR
jgi:Zn-dependent protease with chaperone function